MRKRDDLPTTSGPAVRPPRLVSRRRDARMDSDGHCTVCGCEVRDTEGGTDAEAMLRHVCPPGFRVEQDSRRCFQRLVRPRVLGYFEDYECGCTSELVRYKKDLLGYCADHGSDRRNVWPHVEWPNETGQARREME